jgi:hypothetical protein
MRSQKGSFRLTLGASGLREGAHALDGLLAQLHAVVQQQAAQRGDQRDAARDDERAKLPPCAAPTALFRPRFPDRHAGHSGYRRF